ncbi:MAG: hypothetical protein ABFS17_02875 [Chloroflexota bacterium]
MTIHYDEKGKFYTDIISKKSVPAIIQTTNDRVEGMVHIRRGERLSDELERETKFLAVTEARIFNAENIPTYSSSFLSVAKDNIVWIFPVNGEDEV